MLDACSNSTGRCLYRLEEMSSTRVMLQGGHAKSLSGSFLKMAAHALSDGQKSRMLLIALTLGSKHLHGAPVWLCP